MTLPDTETLALERDGACVHVTLNRPDSRNAMSLRMVDDLMAVFAVVENDESIRALVLRGAGGHFCAGGDIKDMAGARQQAQAGETDAYFHLNRRFGEMITRANALPAVVMAVLEGAVMGGGFGLACVSDIALADTQAKFGMPETSLGVIPAQIAPFVVRRIGLTQTRRLTLTAARIRGDEALRLGLVHEVCEAGELATRIRENLEAVRQCAPRANARTKQLILNVGHTDMDTLLDGAARDFSAAVTGEEGQEGTLAFMQKRAPAWAANDSEQG